MSLTGFERRYIHLPVSTEEDFLIRKILMTHDPDGRQLDAQQLLHAVKNIIHRASPVSEAVCIHSPINLVLSSHILCLFQWPSRI